MARQGYRTGGQRRDLGADARPVNRYAPELSGRCPRQCLLRRLPRPGPAALPLLPCGTHLEEAAGMLADAVVPISYAVKGGGHAAALRAYKSGTPDPGACPRSGPCCSYSCVTTDTACGGARRCPRRPGSRWCRAARDVRPPSPAHAGLAVPGSGPGGAGGAARRAAGAFAQSVAVRRRSRRGRRECPAAHDTWVSGAAPSPRPWPCGWPERGTWPWWCSAVTSTPPTPGRAR